MNGSSPIPRKNSCSSFQLGDGTATIGSLNELRGTRNAMEQRSRYDSLLLSNSTSVVLSGFTLSLCRGVDKATYHICGHQHCRGYGCSWATAVRHPGVDPTQAANRRKKSARRPPSITSSLPYRVGIAPFAYGCQLRGGRRLGRRSSRLGYSNTTTRYPSHRAGTRGRLFVLAIVAHTPSRSCC